MKYYQIKCKYGINKTFKDQFDKYGIIEDNENPDLILPCSYDNPEEEIKNMDIKEGKKYFIIENSDYIAAKEYLWKNMLNFYGFEKTSKMMPNGYVLNDENDLKKFIKDYKKNKIYILKKNIQQQKGLKITNDLTEILNGKYNEYVIVQELLQNPYKIRGHKINLRFYTLVICYKNNINVFVHKNGFMYYTPKKFKKNSMNISRNITTGYIDRKIYKINPLTHNDFRKYLNNKYQNKNISNICFNKIYELIKNIFISYSELFSNQKYNNSFMFQLFGTDIAIDENLNSMVMEINKGPDMNAKDERDKDVKNKVVSDIFKTINLINNDDNNDFIKVL